MHMYPDVCLCVQVLPSHKDTSQLGVQLTPMASFKLNHPFLLNTVTFRGVVGEDFNICLGMGEEIQPTTDGRVSLSR